MIWICGALVCLALAFFTRDALSGLWRRGFRGTPARVVRDDGPPAITAQELLAESARLAAAGTAWPEAAAALNPDADSHVDALLNRIRAVHMGVVADTLHAIEDGCRIALAENAEASGFDALSEAARRGQLATSARL